MTVGGWVGDWMRVRGVGCLDEGGGVGEGWWCGV